MARWFVLPMVPPANAQRKGTPLDPWRPKYLTERGLGWTASTSFRYWMLCQVIGSDADLDLLDPLPDVVELKPGRQIPAAKRTAMQTWLAKRGVTDADLTLTGDALAAELQRICLLVQSRETPQDRAAIFTDLTGL